MDEIDLTLIRGVDPGCADDLVACGLWDRTPHGWQVVEYEKSQTSAAQLAGADLVRRHERQKKARQRHHNRGDHSLCRPDTCSVVPRDTPRDERRDTKDRQGKDRQGKDRQGKAATEEHLRSLLARVARAAAHVELTELWAVEEMGLSEVQRRRLAEALESRAQTLVTGQA